MTDETQNTATDANPNVQREVEAVPAPEGHTKLIVTDYKIGQDNFASSWWGLEFDIHKVVFTVSALGILAFTVLTMAFQTELGPVYVGMRDWLNVNLYWYFLGAGNIFLLLCLFLIVSPLGRVRLGGPQAKPSYSYIGWFSMLFSAGMGIGLTFYGTSEPMIHFDTAMGGISVGEDGVRTDWAPLGGAEGNAAEAARLGIAITIFHWGANAWAIYAVVALALALFSYNKGLPLAMRSCFYPIFGERIWGWPGHIIDILAIFATIFGLATSLGIGAQQSAAGLNFLFGLPTSNPMLITLIIVITAVALGSVVAGLDAGVKRLSEFNMALAATLLFFVIAVGPTMEIASGLFANLVAYGEYLPALSMPFAREDVNFVSGWTSFYWAWWISWSPFVGMFIARVSRGRTVREFLIAVLIVPTLISLLWVTVLGGTALNQLLSDGFTGAQNAELPVKLFEMLTQLPLAGLTSFLAIILVIVFFVTSSDSGSLVIDAVAAGGKVNAPTPQRVFWAASEGLVAIALLLVGGLVAAQAMSLTTALPFTIVLLGACYSVVRGLMDEAR